jgi:hypothetical protein
MPNYIVLHHTAIETPHYDLLLDISPNETLATWRSNTWPPSPGDELHRIQNHRREYLQYQGPVSDNRGDVKRVASGEFELLREEPNHIVIRVNPVGEIRLPIFP